MQNCGHVILYCILCGYFFTKHLYLTVLYCFLYIFDKKQPETGCFLSRHFYQYAELSTFAFSQ